MRTGWFWLLVTVASVTLGGATARAADLTNKGGTSDVPTQQGRVYYIKAPGTSCPSGATCFCNSGSDCTLPSSPTIITGVVVIDRSGVTLDCQHRVIQAPRFGGRQACAGTNNGLGECGYNSTTGAYHPCVNGMCQLERLGGINVGGPLNVDDSPININVDATDDFVKDVTIRNCVVRYFGAGINAEGSPSDDGLDDLEVRNNELKGSFYGMRVSTKDGTTISSNWVHDNAYMGMKLHAVRGFSSEFETVENNWFAQVYVHSMNQAETFRTYNRWLRFVGGDFMGPRDGLWIIDIEGTSLNAPCNSNTARCDLWISGNYISTDSLQVSSGIRVDARNTPSFLLRDNWIHAGIRNFSVTIGQTRDVCHEGNFCNDEPCEDDGSTCWY